MERTRIVLRDIKQRPVDADVKDALIKGLMRAQLALALRLAVVVAVGLGGLPLLFRLAPVVGKVELLVISLPWWLLGVAAYPFLFAVGYMYVKFAEHNERDFSAVVKRDG